MTGNVIETHEQAGDLPHFFHTVEDDREKIQHARTTVTGDLMSAVIRAFRCGRLEAA